MRTKSRSMDRKQAHDSRKTPFEELQNRIEQEIALLRTRRNAEISLMVLLVVLISLSSNLNFRGMTGFATQEQYATYTDNISIQFNETTTLS
jgi:hypothetical protein